MAQPMTPEMLTEQPMTSEMPTEQPTATKMPTEQPTTAEVPVATVSFYESAPVSAVMGSTSQNSWGD